MKKVNEVQTKRAELTRHDWPKGKSRGSPRTCLRKSKHTISEIANRIKIS